MLALPYGLADFPRIIKSGYLLIDEYDNFANEVMVRDGTTYSGLVHGAGPYKELMKTVKARHPGPGARAALRDRRLAGGDVDRPSPALFDLLFEFKFLKLGELGKTGEEFTKNRTRGADGARSCEAGLRRRRVAAWPLPGRSLEAAPPARPSRLGRTAETRGRASGAR